MSYFLVAVFARLSSYKVILAASTERLLNSFSHCYEVNGLVMAGSACSRVARENLATVKQRDYEDRTATHRLLCVLCSVVLPPVSVCLSVVLSVYLWLSSVCLSVCLYLFILSYVPS